jgi:uncharacterized protein with PIN domain
VLPQARVFDSWAVLAFLEDEPSARIVRQMIIDAQQAASALLLTTVNAGEVWYSLARTRSAADADTGLVHIEQLGFQIVTADWQLARAAAAFKVAGKAAYADCFAAALAQLRGVPVVTGDPEFKQFESQIKVHWLK